MDLSEKAFLRKAQRYFPKRANLRPGTMKKWCKDFPNPKDYLRFLTASVFNQCVGLAVGKTAMQIARYGGKVLYSGYSRLTPNEKELLALGWLYRTAFGRYTMPSCVAEFLRKRSDIWLHTDGHAKG